MRPITHLLVAGLLLLALQVSGQTLTTQFTTTAPNPAPIGSNVVVTMKVTGFTQIISLTLPSISFNTAILQLDSVRQVPTLNQFPAFCPELNGACDVPNYTPADQRFGQQSLNYLPAQNRLSLAWAPVPTQSYLNGITRPAGSDLLRFYFKVVGNGTTTVNIAQPAAGQGIIEVTNKDYQPVTVNYQTGGVTIVGGAGGPPAYTGFQLIANTIYIPKNEVGCVPITVHDFDSIITMTYAVNWDPAVLQFTCARAFDLPTLNAGNFFANPATPGRMVANWDGPTPTPSNPNPFVTKPDGAKIFELCFKAIGNAGVTAMVTPNANGFTPASPPEVLNANGVNLIKPGFGIGDTMFVITNPAPASAVTFTLDKDTVALNQQACVDVKVKNFTNINYAEFAIEYDSLKLGYQSISLGTNPLSLTATSVQHQVLLNSNDEEVKFVKFAFNSPASTANGVTVADNTTIFSVCFTAKGPLDSKADVTIHSKASTDPNICIAMGAAKKTSGSTPIKAVDGHVVAKSATQFTVAPSIAQALVCSTSLNGTVNANASACTGTITYNWTGPGIVTNVNKTVASPSGLSAGVYCVTATCSSGATATGCVTLVAPPPITQTNAVATPTCPQGADGAISITTTGGTAPYKYSWGGPVPPPNVTLEDQTGLTSATYKVTVTDANDCTFVSPNIIISQAQPISTTFNITNVKCNAGADGAITTGAITGGTAPYSYLWTGPGSFTPAITKDISGLKAGTYTLVISDSKGCTKAQTPVNVLEPTTALGATATVVANVACFGASDAEIALTVTGGTNAAAATYSWKNAGGTQVSTAKSPDNLGVGTYNVTVTDANGCTTNLATPVTITGPATPLVVGTATVTPASCGGTGGGTITLPISGGNGTYLTNWTGGPGAPIPSGSNLTGLQAGTYVATVTDQAGNGCSITQTVVVPGPPAITIGTPAVTNITCYAQGNGGIVITPAGGSGSGYSVAWNPGNLSGASISNLGPGTYTPTVTDGSGCTGVFASITITEPTEITLSTPVIITQTGGQPNGGFTINISGGTPGYTFELKSLAGALITSGAVVNGTISYNSLNSGTYSLIITDANGCKQPKPIVIPGDFSVTFVSKQDECNDDGSITLQVAASGVAPYLVSGLTPAQPFTTNTISINFLSAGVYNLTVTDAAIPAHTFTLPAITIDQKQPALVGENINQPQQALGNGSILLSPNPATAPMTYLWSDGNTQSARVNLDQGEYCVTVTNLASTCTATYCWTLVRQYPALTLTVNQTNPTCAGTNTGSITANPVGGNSQSYTYKWAGPGSVSTATTKTVSGLAPGTYSVTVTDAQGTTVVLTQSIVLIAQSNLDVTNVNILSNINGFPVSGATICDGIGNVVFAGQSGATTIAWSNGANTAQTNVLCGGAYSVTVTDAIGCTDTWTGTLAAPPAIGTTSESAIQYGTYGVSCPDACNGAAKVRITGGVLPYMVAWPTGQNDQIISANAFSQAVNLCAGNYTVTITDDNAVTSTHVVTVTAPDPMTVQFSDVKPQSFNSCDGQLLVEVAGGVGPYDFSWDGGTGVITAGETQRAENLCAGDAVDFTIIDANGCEITVTDTVAYPNDGCFQVSPVLTPGEQDGLNDYVQITCIDQVAAHTFEVFNRAGQLVFSTSNYENNKIVDSTSKNTWYGLSRSGVAFAEGVYFYVLRYTTDQGKEVLVKGYINLLK